METRSRSLAGALGITSAARPRIFLMVVLLAAAMPYRISTQLPIVDSVSVLDLLLIAAAITLCLDLAFRPIDLGLPPVFWFLSAPFFIAVFSLAWTEDYPPTIRAVIIYAEGLIAYLFVVRELSGVSAARVITFIRRYALLLIIPALLLLLHVPGFAPQAEGLVEGSADHTSYYTRLSHPILGPSNNLATVLAFLTPLLLFWGHVRGDRRTTIAGFVTLAAIFMTQSRGVLLAFLIAGVVYGLLVLGRSRRGSGGFARKVVLAVSLGAIAMAGLYTFNSPTQEFFASRFSLTNVDDRSALMSDALEQIEHRPLLGYGAGVSPGPEVVTVRSEWAGTDLHNTFLQQTVYFGIPLGMVVALSLGAIAAFFLARRASPLGGVIAYVVIAQLVLFLFQSSFEGTVLRVLFYLCIGLAVALFRAAQTEAGGTLRTSA